MKLQPAIVAELVHIHGPMKGNILECSDERISIGRNPSCTIQFPPELTSISRKHAEIIREGNRFKLVDYSTNGTFVNGRKVTEAFLKDGDVLEFSAGGPKVSFLSRETDQPAVPTPGWQSPNSAADLQELPQAPDSGPVPVRSCNEPLPEKTSPAEAEPAPRIPSPIAPVVAAEKVSAPLVIQFGPSIRSFSVLPVVIGSGPGADFVIPDHALLPQHAQILFSQGEYWIRDLSGQQLLCINNNPISLQYLLRVNDLVRLSPQGPLLAYIGEGRFAEAAENSAAEAGPPPSTNGRERLAPEISNDDAGGFWSRLRRRF